MNPDSIIDTLEVDYGTDILSELTGQRLTRNGQPVRLFDQTRHSSEQFFRSDGKGKPYIQNWQEGKRWYPFTAYREAHQLDTVAAIDELRQQYSLEREGFASRRPRRVPIPAPPLEVTTIPVDRYEPCRIRFERNGLFIYLARLFSHQQATDLFEQYRLGTSRRWQFYGLLATCLPQFDQAGQLRQVKVIPFCAASGRRAKKHDIARRWNERSRCYEADPDDKVYFAGRHLLGQPHLPLTQCYFGEHLLGLYPDKSVALVEGESTALVMALVRPEYLWLATGGATGGSWHSPDKFRALQGRKVVLFPDSGKYADWSGRAADLQGLAASLRVSRYVEDHAPAPNLDLRDLLPTVRWIRDGVRLEPEHFPSVPSGDYPPEWDTPH